MCANPRRAPGRLDPSSSELSIEYREVAGAREALWIDAAPRLAGTDSLQQSAANRVAATGNSAGFSELTDDLAQQKAVAEGNQAQQNQLAFANTAYQRQMSALQGLSGLYGVDSNLLGRTLGIPSQLLSVRANAGRSGQGFFTSLGSGLGSTLGALPSALF